MIGSGCILKGKKKNKNFVELANNVDCRIIKVA